MHEADVYAPDHAAEALSDARDNSTPAYGY